MAPDVGIIVTSSLTPSTYSGSPMGDMTGGEGGGATADTETWHQMPQPPSTPKSAAGIADVELPIVVYKPHYSGYPFNIIFDTTI